MKTLRRIAMATTIVVILLGWGSIPAVLAADFTVTRTDDSLRSYAILGLGGADEISGGDGNDTICAGEGNDRLKGGSGKDRLFGQEGQDRLKTRDGVKGNDLADGGSGQDTCRTDLEDRRISC